MEFSSAAMTYNVQSAEAHGNIYEFIDYEEFDDI